MKLISCPGISMLMWPSCFHCQSVSLINKHFKCVLHFHCQQRPTEINCQSCRWLLFSFRDLWLDLWPCRLSFFSFLSGLFSFCFLLCFFGTGLWDWCLKQYKINNQLHEMLYQIHVINGIILAQCNDNNVVFNCECP